MDRLVARVKWLLTWLLLLIGGSCGIAFIVFLVGIMLLAALDR